jgi:hypothetical protein
MRILRPIALGCLALCLLTGCRGMSRTRLFNRGPLEQQKEIANEFDPFPDTTTGPTIEGGRPMDYPFSPPDPDRTQKDRWGGWSR